MVRLMRMCREILEGKGVIVKRPDAAELLDIRNKGIIPYDELVEWAEQEDKALDEVYKTSKLPHQPPRTAIDSLCRQLVYSALN